MGFCEHGYGTVHDSKLPMSGLAERTWSSERAFHYINVIHNLGSQSVSIE
jgi:hypothetical protein